ncbi:MAG: cell envelope integrity protein TolA [Elusimicrobiota bacterium]
MAFDDELDPDWFYELPFYLTAVVVYGVLFTLNPSMRWGSRDRTPDSLVPIEFVAALPPPPAPSPNLAPAPGGDGKAGRTPQKGPGKFEPEKIKKGAVDAPPKPLPNPKPAAVKSNWEKAGSTLAKPKAATKPRPVVKIAARPAVDVKAMVAASAARRQRMDDAKAAKAAAAVEAARRAEEAKAAADARAQIAKEKAEAAHAAALQRAEDARVERARRAEAARVEKERAAAAERARQEALAEARRAKAAKKAELSQELATMNDPDTALDAGEEAAAASADDGGAALAGARKAGAAAALADTAESADPGDAAGSGGSDILDAKATGGGTGPDGSGVSYSLDGPVGNRRVLKRAVPTSPDWVGTRGLDLTVIVRFQVLPDGSVKPGSVILKTSGFPEIDRRALDALRRWRFEAVPSAGAAEVWGRVKFRFTS